MLSELLELYQYYPFNLKTDQPITTIINKTVDTNLTFDKVLSADKPIFIMIENEKVYIWNVIYEDVNYMYIYKDIDDEDVVSPILFEYYVWPIDLSSI